MCIYIITTHLIGTEEGEEVEAAGNYEDRSDGRKPLVGEADLTAAVPEPALEEIQPTSSETQVIVATEAISGAMPGGMFRGFYQCIFRRG